MLAVLICPQTSQATPITYDFVSLGTDANGSIFLGTVTTDGTIGELSAANIIEWTWTTIYSGTSTPLVHGDQGPGNTIGVRGVEATATSIFMPIPTVPDGGTGINSRFILGGDAAYTVDYIYSANTVPYWLQSLTTQISGGGGVFYDVINRFDSPPGDFVIATAAIPEPSSMVLAALGMVALLAYRWRR